MIAREIVEMCETHAELYRLIAAICNQPAAIPLRLRGKTYSSSELPPNVRVANLSQVAAIAVLRLSRDFFAAALRLGGVVRQAVIRATTIIPELSAVIHVRRPDLQWFWQSCQFQLRQKYTPALAAAIKAAIADPWHFDVGTRSFTDFTRASYRCEARFARPGTDIVVSGTMAAAVSLRDKTLLLLMLLWWDETNYAETPPPCTPPCIAAVQRHL